MPTGEIETLKVNNLLTTMYIHLKEIRAILNSEPIHDPLLLAEFVDWTKEMIELLTIISTHRDLGLPDDAPEDLLSAFSLSKNILKQENGVPHDFLVAGCDVIDRLDGILSIPLVDLSPAPEVKPEPPRKKTNVFFSFFRLGSQRVPSSIEPASLPLESALPSSSGTE